MTQSQIIFYILSLHNIQITNNIFIYLHHQLTLSTKYINKKCQKVNEYVNNACTMFYLQTNVHTKVLTY